MTWFISSLLSARLLVCEMVCWGPRPADTPDRAMKDPLSASDFLRSHMPSPSPADPQPLPGTSDIARPPMLDSQAKVQSPALPPACCEALGSSPASLSLCFHLHPPLLATVRGHTLVLGSLHQQSQSPRLSGGKPGYKLPATKSPAEWPATGAVRRKKGLWGPRGCHSGWKSP